MHIFGQSKIRILHIFRYTDKKVEIRAILLYQLAKTDIKRQSKADGDLPSA